MPARPQQAHALIEQPQRNKGPIQQIAARVPQHSVEHLLQQIAVRLPQQSIEHHSQQPYDGGVELDLESQQSIETAPNITQRGMSIASTLISGAKSLWSYLPLPTRLLRRQEEQANEEDEHHDNEETSPSEDITQTTQDDGGDKKQHKNVVPKEEVVATEGWTVTFPSSVVGKSKGLAPPTELAKSSSDVATLTDSYRSMNIDIDRKLSSYNSSRPLLKLPSRHNRYKDPRDFFDHETEHSLPGVEDLKPNPARLAEDEEARQAREEAAKKREEQRKREEAKRQRLAADEKLKPLGLRTPHAPFITPLSQEWEAKVEATIFNRDSPSVKTCAPETLDFQHRDFRRIVPPTEWLNDNSIQAATQYGADYINKAAGITIKKDTPKCVALNSFFWSQLVTTGPHKKERMLKRVWGLTPQNFLGVESIIIPINEHHHWTFALIRPQRREIAYVDSFHSDNPGRVAKIHEFVAAFLGQQYKPEEWKNVSFDIPLQTNGYDCGMFVITNSILLALGLDPSGYQQSDLPLQRRRIAAMILNGGFHGDFDLAGLCED